MIKVVAIATSPAQIFNISCYLNQQNIAFENCLLLHVASRRLTDNELARKVINRYPWGLNQTVSYYERFPKDFDVQYSDLWNTNLAAPSVNGVNSPSKLPRVHRAFIGMHEWFIRVHNWFIRKHNWFIRKHRWFIWPELKETPAVPVSSKATRKAIVKIGELNNRETYVRTLGATLPAFREIDKVIFGDYRPITFKLIASHYVGKSTKFIVVDDGSASKHAIRYRSGQEISDEITSHIPELVHGNDPFIYWEPENVTYFSIYNTNEVAERDSFIYNDYYDKIASDNNFKLVDEIWIVGANHVEANLSNYDIYIQAVKNVCLWFPSKKIVYIPHRREDDDKLQYIFEKNHIEIRHTNVGIEDY